MRFLLTALLVLVAAVGLGLVLMKEPGYVLIGYGPWSVETTLSMLVAILLAGFAALYFGLRFLVGLVHTPRRLAEWERKRKALRARKALNRGLIALAEGDWATAERRLIKYAEDGDTPLLNYLAAARAAQQQGAHERRDLYLRLAHEAMPEADVAVGLTQAELQIAHKQMEQALATLTHLRSVAPRHAHVLEMLMRLYEQLGDWERLHELLPELRKRKVLDAEGAEKVALRVDRERLIAAIRSQDPARLKALWSSLPARTRREPDLVLVYASALKELGEEAAAEKVLREAIRRHWDERLVDLYGRVAGDPPGVQLQAAEEWLHNHERSPVLLQALGRIALRNELWGKARHYLETAVRLRPTVEGYQLLGSLLDRMGEPNKAVECFRKGVELAAGEPAPALPPAASG